MESFKFKRIEKESGSGTEEDFNSAFETIRQSETQPEMGSGGYLMEKTYTITRKSALIVGAIVILVVMVLFVISAVIGHYTAKKAITQGRLSAQDVNYSPWGNWGRCSETCGIGTQMRRRVCLDDDPETCIGSSEEVRVCVQPECNDDTWADWSPWGECKKVGGVCKKSRDRSCHNTALNVAGGRCVGKATETTKCKKEDCFAYSWSEWDSWSECSVHCDMGVQTRGRTCRDQDRKQVNITRCHGDRTDKQWCHNIACKDANECESNPCQNGFCVDKFQTYECVCNMGWKGDNCEIVDNCASSPCVHGNCTSHNQGYNCTCIGAIGPRCEIALGDCKDIRDSGVTKSGPYTVQLPSLETVKVYCDMETDGGGWTVFQYRFDGSVDFYRNFSQYEYGFGSFDGEFWLGLYYIYHLSKPSAEMRIDLEAHDNTKGYEKFQRFSISSPQSYRLDVGSPSGSISPSSTGIMYNDGEEFSTFDRDRSGNNCAVKDHGGWWFDNCAYANLNGFYNTPGSTSGYNGRQEAAMTYRSFKSYSSLKSSKMMFRRKS